MSVSSMNVNAFVIAESVVAVDLTSAWVIGVVTVDSHPDNVASVNLDVSPWHDVTGYMYASTYIAVPQSQLAGV